MKDTHALMHANSGAPRTPAAGVAVMRLAEQAPGFPVSGVMRLWEWGGAGRRSRPSGPAGETGNRAGGGCVQAVSHS